MSQSKLRGLIREKYGTQSAFARAMDETLKQDPDNKGQGLSDCSLSKKLNGHSEWSAAEIRAACKLLSIKPEDISLYFPVYFF